MLKNYMEELVDYWLPRIFSENAEKYQAVCRCPSCMAQIKCEALNRLKPFYVTGKAGEVYGEYRLKESQYKMDLMIAITTAIEIVDARAHGKMQKEQKPLPGASKRKTGMGL